MFSDQLAQFRLTYELAPIFFIGGITGNTPGSGVPITSYTQGQDFTSLFRPSSKETDPDSFFARFVVISGGALIDNQAATYPLLNLTIAANAIITNPLSVSLRMICPVGASGAYSHKLSVMTALKNTISQHINLGGTFNVATPAYLYTGMLLTKLHDITPEGNPQVQFQWQWDFFQPLISSTATQAAENTTMGKIGVQVPAVQESLLANIGAVVPSGSIIPNAFTATGNSAKPPANSQYFPSLPAGASIFPKGQ